MRISQVLKRLCSRKVCSRSNAFQEHILHDVFRFVDVARGAVHDSEHGLPIAQVEFLHRGGVAFACFGSQLLVGERAVYRSSVQVVHR
jgi:hypothetical protein